MSIDEKTNKAKEMLSQQLDELGGIVKQASQDQDFDTAGERLKRWKTRTVNLISSNINPIEGEKLNKKVKMSFFGGQPLRNLADEADMYRGFILSLSEEIENHPEDILCIPTCSKSNLSKSVDVPQPTESRTIFIVHGHDELNLLRLEKMLRERWGIDPIILNAEPSKGRTLIEKFEQEAQRATYAMILFTPDDLIEVAGTQYAQARPNVIFELGWFFGRLGRQKVCILFKKGTKIHSDLDGIMRIEFNETVNEKLVDIEKELKNVGLI